MGFTTPAYEKKRDVDVFAIRVRVLACCTKCKEHQCLKHKAVAALVVVVVVVKASGLNKRTLGAGKRPLPPSFTKP